MADPEYKSDGFVSVAGGMNSTVASGLIKDTQAAMLLNCSSRTGLLHTRPRWQRAPYFVPAGKYQGAFIYQSRTVDYIAVVVSGTLYLIDIATGKRIRCGSFPTTNFARAYFVQADRYLIVQNGISRPVENWPIIMDGQLLLDNGSIQIPVDTGWGYLEDQPNYTAKRVPIGTHMTYCQGRLFVTVSRLWDNGLLSGSAQWLYQATDKYFVAGDIIKPDNPDEVLAFTELDYLSQGGAFSLPSEYGQITGMSAFRNAATGTGVGELIVAGEYGMSAFGIGASREQWASVSLAQSLFAKHGVCSDRSFVPVNNDLAFRSADGMRFVRFSASTAQGAGSLVSLPQSMEITTILDVDGAYERRLASIAVVDERVVLTTNGVTVSGATVNPDVYKFITPLDLYVIGSTDFNSPASPAYDGVWSGPQFLEVFGLPTGEDEYLAAMCRVNDTQTEVWMLDPTAVYDGNTDRPVCRVETRSFEWGDPTSLKEWKYGEVWVSGLRGSVDFTMYWRPDNYAFWIPCNTVSVEACESGADQARWALRFTPTAESTFDPATNRNNISGYEFQFCLEWRGVATIEKVSLVAMPKPNATPNVGCESETCVPLFSSASTGLELTVPWNTISPLVPLTDPGEQVAIERSKDKLFWESEPYQDSNGDWYYDIIYVSPVPGTTPNWVPYDPNIIWEPETSPEDPPFDGSVPPLNPIGPGGTPIGPGEPVRVRIHIHGDPEEETRTLVDDDGNTHTPSNPPIPTPDAGYVSLLVELFDDPYLMRPITYITRGGTFVVRISAFREVTTVSADGVSTTTRTRYKPGSSLVASVILRDPATSSGGPTYNGDAFTPNPTAEIVWTSEGVYSFEGSITGGSNTNDLQFVVTAHLDLPSYTGISGHVNVSVIADVLEIAPSSDSLTFDVGGADQVVNLTLSNNLPDDIDWISSIVDADAGLSGKIALAPDSGTVSADGTEAIAMTVSAPATDGTYNATIRFSDCDDATTYADMSLGVTASNPLPDTVSVTFDGEIFAYSSIVGMVHFYGGTFTCTKIDSTHYTYDGGVRLIELTYSGGIWTCRIRIYWPGIASGSAYWNSSSLQGSYAFDHNSFGDGASSVTAVSVAP